MKLPVILFVATGLSTFWVGVNHWLPFPFGTRAWQLLFVDWAEGLSNMANILRQVLVAHWLEGLTYMACVMAILLTHEMGHFLATLRYRIPASLPFFIPFPDFADRHDGSGDRDGRHGRIAARCSTLGGRSVGRLVGRGSDHVDGHFAARPDQ